MANSEFSFALRNYAGIPVVELAGEINKKTLATLNELLGKLIQAGHYNVMINLKKVVLDDLSILRALEKASKLFRTHYGNIHLIAETRQISGIESKHLASLFRFFSSEGQALTRIRRLPAPSASGVMPMSAHLIES